MRAKLRRTCLICITTAITLVLLLYAFPTQNWPDPQRGGDKSHPPWVTKPGRKLNRQDSGGKSDDVYTPPWDGSLYAPKDDVDFETYKKQRLLKLDPNILELEAYLNQTGNPVECATNLTLEQLYKKAGEKKKMFGHATNWEKFYWDLGTCDLYRKDSKIVYDLMEDLRTLKVSSAVIHSGGTQSKLILTFTNKQQAMFKPLRYGLNYETNPNHFYFSDFERANAEIAAFHLDRLLGFRRAIPTVGRKFSLTQLKDKADKSLARTFFISPAKNLCFVSKCDYYCDTGFAVCGNPDMISGSVQAMLPSEDIINRDHVRSLYRRTYSKRRQLAEWQTNNDYCKDMVIVRSPYATDSRRLLDVVDLYIFDYIMGNLDRHHYEVIEIPHRGDIPGYPVHLDNGRGFGKPREDSEDIMSPLFQCCVIRPSTLRTLMNFYRGTPKTLSQAMHDSMSEDPLAPVLADKHMPALDRRVAAVLSKVVDCIDARGDWKQVIRAGYTNPEWVSDPPKEEDSDD